jgi:tetratricopeptide (TPR) repeat protein
VSGVHRKILVGIAAVLLVHLQGDLVPSHALTRGRVVRRNIAAGESHTYDLHLIAGEFLKVGLRQHEIDLSLILLAPNGTLTFRLFVPPWGHRVAEIVSKEGGLYRLTVSASTNGSRSGQYDVAVEHSRYARSEDEIRMQAQAAASQGMDDLRGGSGRQQDKAMASFQEAVRLARRAGDQVQEAECLYWLGRTFSRAARYEEARASLLEAARIFREEAPDELALTRRSTRAPSRCSAISRWRVQTAACAVSWHGSLESTCW